MHTGICLYTHPKLSPPVFVLGGGSIILVIQDGLADASNSAPPDARVVHVLVLSIGGCCFSIVAPERVSTLSDLAVACTLFVVLSVTVALATDRQAGSNITLDTGMVDVRGLAAYISRLVQLDNHSLRLKQVRLERIQEAFRLQMLAGSTNRDTVVFDNVSNTKPIWDHRSETKHSQRWISTIRSGHDRVIELDISCIRKDGRRRGGSSSLMLFPQVVQSIQVSIVTLTRRARSAQLGMPITRLSQRIDLVLNLGIRIDKRFHKFGRVRLYSSDRFRTPMQESFGHGWLVSRLATSVEGVVGGLERHLYEGVGRESMTSDKVFAVPVELQHLAFILTDQVGQSRLAITDAVGEFGG